MKNFIKLISKILIIAIIAFIAFVTYLTILDYKPSTHETFFKSQAPHTITKKTLEIITWNIGYAGLGNNMDFFFDGGKKVRDTKIRTEENLIQIAKFINTNKNTDFIILQEVDTNSDRTYNINEADFILKSTNKYKSFFSLNYKVAYVPFPITNPMGKINSGLVTLSKYEPISISRHSFTNHNSWPKKIFMLDYCFMVSKFKTENNKSLIIINTHNTAFADKKLKHSDLKTIQQFAETEYKKGNYVIIGGDWNQSPPNFNLSSFGKIDTTNFEFKLYNIDSNIFKNFNIYFDSTQASNRFLNTPYIKNETQLCILDFFVCSPNINLIKIETINLDFVNSDHNPVKISLELL
jgi:endonuclease/exonuclease/phosphatase family metal-dependent hydrolase